MHEPELDLRDDLIDHNSIDPMEGEQTWPTEEEIQDAEARVRNKEHEVPDVPFGGLTKKKVPKGTSSYQAAWILEDDEDGEELSSDDGMDHESVHSVTKSASSEEEEEEYEEVDMESRVGHFDELGEEENAEQYFIIYQIGIVPRKTAAGKR